MTRPKDILRVARTAKREFRERGLRGLFGAIQQRRSLKRQLAPYKTIKSVVLDGCTFDVASLPNASIKVALLNESYEGPERRSVRKHIDPDLPVIELGGCIGVVACITNKLLSDPTAHVVVEASPAAFPHLAGNRTRNRCQFEPLNAALSYGEERVSFVPSMDFWGNSLRNKGDGESVSVKTTRLEDIVSKNGFESFTLICDIEGYEYELIRNEQHVFRNASTIILETHARMIGELATEELLNILRQLGFKTVDEESTVLTLQRSSNRIS